MKQSDVSPFCQNNLIHSRVVMFELSVESTPIKIYKLYIINGGSSILLYCCISLLSGKQRAFLLVNPRNSQFT